MPHSTLERAVKDLAPKKSFSQQQTRTSARNGKRAKKGKGNQMRELADGKLTPQAGRSKSIANGAIDPGGEGDNRGRRLVTAGEKFGGRNGRRRLRPQKGEGLEQNRSRQEQRVKKDRQQSRPQEMGQRGDSSFVVEKALTNFQGKQIISDVCDR